MEFTQFDYEDRKGRQGKGSFTDEDARLLALYEAEGFRPAAGGPINDPNSPSVVDPDATPARGSDGAQVVESHPGVPGGLVGTEHPADGTLSPEITGTGANTGPEPDDDDKKPVLEAHPGIPGELVAVEATADGTQSAEATSDESTEAVPLTDDEPVKRYSELTKADLHAEAKRRGLSTSGSQAAIVSRLEEADAAEGTSTTE